tara:strand:- start:1239 stop:2249 length:1011 start_codon:yes stop_codon:yes gene_type:complete
MIRKSSILITGAGGEVGSELIKILSHRHDVNLVTLDLHSISNKNSHLISDQITGNILDVNLLNQINLEFEIKEIYHLAAILSTRAELSPKIAHDVNINGTINLLELAMTQTKTQNKPVKFFFPSSIAVYGANNYKNAVVENEYLNPITIYGCNKLYAEKLGVYYSKYYNQLSGNHHLIDFRSIRLPGLISSQTIPSGGTSDFIPEMWHSLNNNNTYECFVEANTRIPFLAMPDAIKAINQLMSTEEKEIKSRIYNITSFNPSPSEFFETIKLYFKDSTLSYNVNAVRQNIVSSWPQNVNDSLAKNEWGWEPTYNLNDTIDKYLLPSIDSNNEGKND